jgi:uncharacterized membrane protein YhaH (DUF805 family)
VDILNRDNIAFSFVVNFSTSHSRAYVAVADCAQPLSCGTPPLLQTLNPPPHPSGYMSLPIVSVFAIAIPSSIFALIFLLILLRLAVVAARRLRERSTRAMVAQFADLGSIRREPSETHLFDKSARPSLCLMRQDPPHPTRRN